MARKTNVRQRLAEYRRKRDFRQTPEPSGDTAPAVVRGNLYFCVQKHLASHLHYDFRLEYRGTLLSWAVPKGPSLNPRDKRLAMQVEDHPLDYGDFEGVIPEGYGAGIVMLWDRGTWTPLVEDVDEALKEGELKFRLDGVKLKGSWVLVRTGRREEGERRSWLLIKHRDAWSGELDITTFAPRSVKSGHDFEQILAGDNPGVWASHKAGGRPGKMLQEVIARAAALKSAKAGAAKASKTRKPRKSAVKSTAGSRARR